MALYNEQDKDLNFAEIRTILAACIQKASQAGINAANNNKDKYGQFEEKFTVAFVRYVQKEVYFPTKFGTLGAEHFGADQESKTGAKRFGADQESKTGADVRLEWKSPSKTLFFTLYLQIKVLYESYRHYFDTIHYNEPGKKMTDWETKRWEKCSRWYFDAIYASTAPGPYKNDYQLLRLQAMMEDTEQHNYTLLAEGFKKSPLRHMRTSSAYLVFESPKGATAGSLSKAAYLVFVKAFQMAIRGANAEDLHISKDDVAALNGSDLVNTWKWKVGVVPDDSGLAVILKELVPDKPSTPNL